MIFQVLCFFVVTLFTLVGVEGNVLVKSILLFSPVNVLLVTRTLLFLKRLFSVGSGTVLSPHLSMDLHDYLFYKLPLRLIDCSF